MSQVKTQVFGLGSGSALASSSSLEVSPSYIVGGGRARRWIQATGCGSTAPLMSLKFAVRWAAVGVLSCSLVRQ
jgi:hypothetical protein